jgi:hypothetical protein
VPLRTHISGGTRTTEILSEKNQFTRRIFILEQNMKEFSMTVTNLSRFGLQFNSSESEKLKVGDRIGVEFRLDDKSRSLIRKKIIISPYQKNRRKCCWS